MKIFFRECGYILFSFLVGSLISQQFAYSQPQKSVEHIPKVQHYSININQYESKGIGKGLKFLNHDKEIQNQKFDPQNEKYWKFRITDVAVFEGNAKYLRFRIIKNDGEHLRHEYLQLRDEISAKVFTEFLLGDEPVFIVYDVLYKSVVDQNNGLRYLDHPAVMIYNTVTKKSLKLYELVDLLVKKYRTRTGNYGLHIFEMVSDYINKKGTFSKGYQKKKAAEEIQRLENERRAEEIKVEEELKKPENLNDKEGTPNEVPIIQGR